MIRILIADDEARIVAFIQKGLQQQGYSTEVAYDGEEVLDKVSTQTFDLILLDLGMPKLDGWGVLDHLQSLSNATPVIVITAQVDTSDHTEASRRGAHDYINKPFRFHDLLDRIRLLVNKG